MRSVKVLVAVVVVALLGATAAFAATAFEDVPQGAFYDEPTAWAVEQGLTVGCDRAAGQAVSDTFCPLANVSRGENITFTYRHQTLVIDPLLEEIRGDVAAADVPDRVVWVADDGTGDFTSLSAALESITDASVSNPYVVRIAPGTYTETSTVELKAYVDVEGSGEGVTTITCACATAGDGAPDASTATVLAGDIVAEIRHLTIENTGGDNYSTGIWTENVVDGSVSMLHVTATATGDGAGYGVRNDSSSPSMTNVTATGTSTSDSGFGVYNASSSPSMMNVTATGAATVFKGYGVFNRSSSSPMMTNVIATGTSTSDEGFGVFNASSSPSMMNVTATGSTNSASRGLGVYNELSSSPSMMNVTASGNSASGPSFGVYNKSSSSSIRASVLSGFSSLYNDAGSSAEVAATMLDGAVDGTGDFTCVGAYDETFVELDTDCTVVITPP